MDEQTASSSKQLKYGTTSIKSIHAIEMKRNGSSKEVSGSIYFDSEM